jgi:regulator of protease activity HflC (stomatin/prohibitin superfamily)
MITFIVLLVVGVFWLFGSIVIVPQQTARVIERLEKFHKIASAGRV